jgi:DNA-binding beta-propeller fold protein YncE
MQGPRGLLGLAAGLSGILLGAGCGGDSSSGPDYGSIEEISYSDHVQPIFNASCNSAACHNGVDRSAGLALTGHDAVAAGSDVGAMVVPYFADRSHLWLHTTGAIEPQMPLARDPLDQQVIDFLRRWIDEGAVDDAGAAMYSDVLRKAFVACQGENTVAVVDMDTGLCVRHLEVDQPHSVYVDPATRRLYVSRFETATDNIWVYDADTYERIRTGQAGTYPALMTVVRPAGQAPQLWVTNFDSDTGFGDHAVRVLDPATLSEIWSYTSPSGIQPHGIAVSADQSRVYICNIASGTVSIFSTDPLDLVDGPVAMPAAGGAHQPQQCVLSADEKYLFVGALGVDKVYVMDLTGPSAAFLPGSTVDVGNGPWHLALAPGGTELWVANWLESSVSVVDVSNPVAPVVKATLSPPNPVDTERDTIQRPIGVAFSPDGSEVYVTSANDDGAGSGHHPPPDGEKAPGNVAVFDASSYQVLHVAEVPNFARFVSFLP